MSNPDSFIDEVAEEVRRERLYGWLRRWGWLVALAVLAVVAGAGLLEWREAQARAGAQLRGEAILSALEVPDAEGRLEALSDLPREGEAGVVAALLLATEQQAEGQGEAAAATLEAVAADGAVPPLYRDLAALKALMIRGPEADRAALEALASPGAPFRLLALEQLAATDLAAGRTDDALASLRAVVEDAAVGPAQRDRVGRLMTALGAPPEAAT